MPWLSVWLTVKIFLSWFKLTDEPATALCKWNSDLILFVPIPTFPPTVIFPPTLNVWLIFVVPTTSKFVLGDVLPIPTFSSFIQNDVLMAPFAWFTLRIENLASSASSWKSNAICIALLPPICLKYAPSLSAPLLPKAIYVLSLFPPLPVPDVREAVPPAILTTPFTSSLSAGVVVPIPTFPPSACKANELEPPYVPKCAYALAAVAL